MVTALDQSGQATPLDDTSFAQGSPKFSPNGQWLAYCTNESGRPQVYVKEFPNGAKIQIFERRRQRSGVASRRPRAVVSKRRSDDGRSSLCWRSVRCGSVAGIMAGPVFAWHEQLLRRAGPLVIELRRLT